MLGKTEKIKTADKINDNSFFISCSFRVTWLINSVFDYIYDSVV